MSNLITCPDCHNAVSPNAVTCPHCGGAIRAYINGVAERQRKERVGKLICTFLGVVLIVLAIVLFSFSIIGSILLLLGGLLLISFIQDRLVNKFHRVPKLAWMGLGVMLGFLGLGISTSSPKKISSTPATVATPTAPVKAKTPEQLAMEKQKRDSDKLLADAQADYNRTHPKPAETVATQSSNVSSNSSSMSFSDCKNQQSSAVTQLAGTANKTMTMVNSNEVSIIKICTSDGAVLVTCSASDGKMVTTKTDNTTGC